MSITFACGQCGKPFTVDEKFGGKKGKCKQCGALMMIPTASLVSPAPRSVEREISPSRRAPKPPKGADVFGFEDEARPNRAISSVMEDEEFSPALAPRPKRAPAGVFDPPAKRKKKRRSSEEEPAAMVFFRILLGLAIGSAGTVATMIMMGTFQGLSGLSMPSFGSPFGADLDSILRERIDLNRNLATFLATVTDVPSASAASASANRQVQELTANLRKLKAVKAPVNQIEATGRKHLPAMNAATHELVQQFLRIAAIPGAYDALNVAAAMEELEGEENKLGMNKGNLNNFRAPAPVMPPRIPTPNFNPQPTGPSPPMPGPPPNLGNRNRAGGRRPSTRPGFGGP